MGIFDFLKNLSLKDLDQAAANAGLTRDRVEEIARQMLHDPEMAKQIAEKLTTQGAATLQDVTAALILTACDQIHHNLRAGFIDPKNSKNPRNPRSHPASPRIEPDPMGPPREEDPYEVLKVSRDSNPDFVRRVYRNRVMAVHPDRGGSAEEFRRVQEAMNRINADWRGQGEEHP